MTTFAQVLKAVSELSREEQNEVEDILRKRRIEARREEIAANAREAIAEDDAGLLRSETASELIQRLRSLTESANATD